MEPAQDIFLFQHDAKAIGGSDSFFTGTALHVHLDVLKSSRIGGFLCALTSRHHIELEQKDDLDAIAQYIYLIDRPKQGKIQFGKSVHAAILAHEMRHFWQQYIDAERLARPISVEEYAILKRFIEADARAMGFGITVEIAGHLRLSNPYSGHLVSCLDEGEKDILEYNSTKLEKTAASPALLNQAMRQRFDQWIAIAPQQVSYEASIQNDICNRDRNKLFRILGSAIMMRRAQLLSLTATGVRPDYVANLAKVLGQIGVTGDNYLTMSKGLQFTDPFYSRISNLELEYISNRLAPQIRDRRLIKLHL